MTGAILHFFSTDGFLPHGIDVNDSGIGIAEERLSHIFEEFYQVGVSPNTVREGHGLGLSIVRRAVQLLHHELLVQSKLGQGTTFSIVLRAGVTSPALRRAIFRIDGDQYHRSMSVRWGHERLSRGASSRSRGGVSLAASDDHSDG